MLQRQKERCIERGLLEMPAHSFFPTIAIEAAVVHYICKEGGGGKELTTKRPFLSSIGKSMTTHKRRRKKKHKRNCN
jgi:hypothetical protein